MPKGDDFEFIPHFCAHCGQKISLNPNRLAQYERRGYPRYIPGHQFFGNNNVMKRPEVKAKITGISRPDFSAYLRTLTGQKNPNFKNKSQIIPEPFIEIVKPKIKPILSFEEQKKIAIGRLESQRLQKITEFEESIKNRPKEKSRNNFGMVMCIIDGKFIKCKKSKAFCSHYDFCHSKK